MNTMQQPRIEKVTLNVGAGKEPSILEKGMVIIKKITGIDPIKTVTAKRIPTWGLRPGLPIGCKLTLRKQQAQDVLKRLLEAKENRLKPTNFDKTGNVSFGIAEYIDIPGIEYDPKIGVLGLQVCITLEKPGHRIKRRKLKTKKIPVKHRVSREEAMEFMQENYNTQIGDAS